MKEFEIVEFSVPTRLSRAYSVSLEGKVNFNAVSSMSEDIGA